MAQDYLEQTQPLEEIVIDFYIPKLVSEDVFVYFDGRSVYLPLTRIFNIMGFNINVDPVERSYRGFLANKDDKYELNMTDNRIRCRGKEFPYLTSDYYLDRDELYIKLKVYGELFDLEMVFDFTTMKVSMPLNKEFPTYQKILRRRAREKLRKKEDQLRDVVSVPHHRDYFAGGVADWVISASPMGSNAQHFYNVNTGVMVLGGDLNLYTAGNSKKPFDADQLTYKWHYFVDENALITQAELGFSSVGGPLARGLTGAVITNRPQARRKFFETIEVSDFVGEGWEVELWVENKLTDYVITDHTGTYSFFLDTHYGATTIDLKMYGPNGELKTVRREIRVPYTLIPKNTVEYSLGAGQSAGYGEKSLYAQGTGYYGIFTNLTAGINIDAPIATDEDEKKMAALDITYQPLGNLTINGSLAPGYIASGRLSFSQPSLISVAARYNQYFENPFRNPLRQEYSFGFSVTAPIIIAGHHMGLRYHTTIDKYPTLVSTNMNYGFNVSVNPFHLNYIGRYKKSDHEVRTQSNTSSQILFSSQWPRFLRPQFRIDYDHSSNQLLKYGVYLMKRVFKNGQISLSYERNPLAGSDMLMLSINFYSSFASFATRLLRSGGQLSANQIQRGSVRYNRETHGIHFDRRNNVGFGNAMIRPFLDDNYNGLMDRGEQYVPGLRARISAARTRKDTKANEYYYEGLKPYERYMVQIDKLSLDDPMLRPAYENYEVTINPNVTTSIRVPIVTASDMMGRIERKVSAGRSGAGGVKLVLINLSKETVIEITSFNNGDLYYFGLLPGSYRAYIDDEQLAQFGYKSQPESINFEVQPIRGGTTVEDINFLLVPANLPSPTE